MPVWQSIPNYLSDKIESIQKRALRIVFPSADNYNDALEVARLDTLACRGEKLCIEYNYAQNEELKSPSSSSSTNKRERQ